MQAEQALRHPAMPYALYSTKKKMEKKMRVHAKSSHRNNDSYVR